VSEPQSRTLAQSQQELARQYQQKLQTEQQLDQVRQQPSVAAVELGAVGSNLAAPATAQPQMAGIAGQAPTSGYGMMPGGAGAPGQPPAAGYRNAMPGAGGMGMGYGDQASRDESRVAGRMDSANAPQGGITRGAVADAERTIVLGDDVQLWDRPAGQVPAADFQQTAPPSDVHAVETHLASLDVDLPLRGREYLFTTPRGDIDITARAVSEPLLGRLYRLLVIAIGFVVLLVLLRVLPRVARVLHRSRWFAAAVLLAGLLSLLLGIFPILALAALIYGLVQLIHLEIARRRKIRPVDAAS
jgi:hypothetical protein